MRARQGPEPDPHAGLLIPDLVAEDRPQADLVGRSGFAAYAALRAGGEGVPAADELLDLDRDVEEILQDLLQRDGRAGLWRQGAGVENERLVRYRHPVAVARQPQTHQIEEVLRDAIPAVPLVAHRQAVFLPGPVEQGDDPMLEDVEEALERPVPRAQPLGHEQGVVIGQHAQRADQAHEVDAQPARPRARQLEVLNFARREGDGRMGREMGDLVAGIAELAHPRALGVESLEEADRLEEAEGGRLRREPRGEFGRP